MGILKITRFYSLMFKKHFSLIYFFQIGIAYFVFLIINTIHFKFDEINYWIPIVLTYLSSIDIVNYLSRNRIDYDLYYLSNITFEHFLLSKILIHWIITGIPIIVMTQILFHSSLDIIVVASILFSCYLILFSIVLTAIQYHSLLIVFLSFPFFLPILIFAIKTNILFLIYYLLITSLLLIFISYILSKLIFI